MMALFAFGLFSYMQVFSEFKKYSNTHWELSTELPTDRCVPWLQSAVSLAQPNWAVSYYDKGMSMVRLCTNLTSAATDAVLGAEYRYDPLSVATDGACKLTDPSLVAVAAAQCIGVDGIDCAAALYTPPLPFGVTWNHAIGTPANGSCAVTIRRFSSPFPNCTQAFVWDYQKTNYLVKYVFTVAFGASIVLASLELFGVMMLMALGKPSCLWSIAQQNALGPVYTAIRVLLMKKGAPPVRPYTCFEWPIMLILDLISNVVMPFIAVWGCSFSSNLLLLVQFIGGLIKTVIAVGISAWQLYNRTCLRKAASEATGPDAAEWGAGKGVQMKATVTVVNPVAAAASSPKP